MLGKILKTIAPLVGLGAIGALAACSYDYGLKDGVPLAELDIDGAKPNKLELGGPDDVIVREGETLAIAVSGSTEAKEGLRFRLDGDSLAIGREGNWDGPSVATISVTMPSLRAISMAGSGKLTAPSLTGNADINVAGSGDITVLGVSASKLGVNIMGSGDVKLAGTAETLDYNVAGSGALNARGLKVGKAEINIAGSGGGEIASDGTVEAHIAGSGDVTVFGRADCTVKSVGSGELRCRNTETARAPDAPSAPQPGE
ncbi:head GIN domain-containing protein [Qipengyuania sp.]|uniref:head GIN domain-containing protein n=1 Tax=Qipengyuania sp. TaxID=2004515 RepID=UPI0035C852A1